MARPRTHRETRIATAVRLPESVHRRPHEATSDQDVSVNLLITRAVTQFLDRLPTTDAALWYPNEATRPATIETTP